MTPTPNCAVPAVEPPQQPAGQQPDPALAAAVDIARAAAAEEAGAEQVGRHVGVESELDGAATHLFDAELPGYRGWRWAATVASAGVDTPVTVSEVVLLPGPDALTAPEWVPWQQRVQAGDLGVGDLMPTAPEDPRLVPGYLQSDDPAVEEVAMEVGLGRVRVLSRFGRLDSAERWQTGDFGPHSDMARGAPDRCGRCGFYVPVDGSLRAAFGVCANELSPADGRVVHVEYGCGAHSEVELDMGSPVPVADLVYDDNTMDIEISVPAPAEPPAVEETTSDEAVTEATVTEATAAEDTAADATDATAAEDTPALDAPETEVPGAEALATDTPAEDIAVEDVLVEDSLVEDPQAAEDLRVAEAAPVAEITVAAEDTPAAVEDSAAETPADDTPATEPVTADDTDAATAEPSITDAATATEPSSDEPAPPATDA